ncbi:MAG: response regulator [Calditrichaeota bacterium]|nr:MAG: response regulator [Calditrichota bacterium]
MPHIQTNENDNLLYNILHYTSDAIIIVRLNEDALPGSIVNMSDAAVSILQRPLREMLDTDIATYIHENAYRELTLMNGKATQTVNLDIVSREGKIIPLKAHVSRGSYRNQDVLIIIARDSRERQQLENKLSQIEKLEAVGQLAGGIAHDFNNVLAGISGLAELTLRKLPEDHKAVSSIKTIYQKANNTANMVRQLVAFSRKQSLTQKETDVNKIIRQNQKLLERYLGEDIRFIIDTQAGLHIIRIDPSALDQIITNMCINARDAMPDGGTLTIRTRNITTTRERVTTSGLMPAGRYVHLAIEDTGMGIADDTLKHIFEPFYTTKDVGYGTGLGLSIVYGLLKQHGGFIDCRSQIGEGTQFDMYFPFYKEQQSKKNKKQSEVKLSGTESILLVEDEADLILFLKESLELYGYTVYIAHNGAKALDIFETKKDEIQLVISDVVMPELGGIELKLILEKQKPELHFLLISAYTNRLEPGVPFLQKPFQSRELLEVVRAILDKTYRHPEDM